MSGSSVFSWCGPTATMIFRNWDLSSSRSANGRAAADFAAAAADELGGRLRKQARQVDARQEEIARVTVAAERIAQRGEEGIGRRLLERRVERGNAERRPQVVAHAAVLAVLVEELLDRDVGLDAEADPPQRRHEAQRAETLGERKRRARASRPASSPSGAGNQRERRLKSAGVAQLERIAQQRVRRHADGAHQAKELACTRRRRCAGRCRARDPGRRWRCARGARVRPAPGRTRTR